MKKLLISAGALTALALTSAPAFAQAVPATAQANAQVRIYQPLTLTRTRDLNLGTVVLGPGTYTEAVSINQAGTPTCGPSLTCSGTRETAQFDVTGTINQNVALTIPASISLANQTQVSPALTLTLDGPVSVALNGSGEASFDVGGSISVSDSTPEGVYQGTFNVSANYQ